MKMFVFIVSLFLSLPLFAEQIDFPKNNNPVEIEESITYYDDSTENAYRLYAVTFRTNAVNLIGLHIIRTSLITNVETSIVLNFETEDDLDEFIDYSYIQSDYSLEDTPEYFSDLKKFITNMGVQPLYIMDEKEQPKKIIYKTTLSKIMEDFD